MGQVIPLFWTSREKQELAGLFVLGGGVHVTRSLRLTSGAATC